MAKDIETTLAADALRPTTKDLARHAGVSRATVDRVLNGREGVRQDTVDRVNAAIEELGFVRNLSAANLAKGKTYRFLFALPSSGDQFLQEIQRHITEANRAFSDDMVRLTARQIDDSDPHRIAEFLANLTPDASDGLAIMAPETPQVRDAILRLQERGVPVVPFISNQTLTGDHWVGIDNRAAGATAATLMSRFVRGRGKVAVIAESMQSRDSLERRLGFDEVLARAAPGLQALPTLETHGNLERAEGIIGAMFHRQADIVGVYVLSAEARVPLTVIGSLVAPGAATLIAHERTPCTEAAMLEGRLDALITQDPGHLVRSAIRRMRALVDGRPTLASQEKIRIEILLKTNL
jgi:LacI family transcriptional regulator